MAPRRTFEGGLVQGIAIPNINFANLEAQRNAANDLNQRLESIKTFALKQGAYEATLRAAEYVAGNAPDLSVYKNATLAERKKLEEDGYFQGKITSKTSNLYDRAVKEHQVNYIKAEFETMAVNTFENVLAMAEEQNMSGNIIDPLVIKNMIESEVNGLSDAVTQMDAEAGLDIRADLATKGDAYYSTYLDSYIENKKAQYDADTSLIIEDSYKPIKNYFAYGDRLPYGVNSLGEPNYIGTVNYLLTDLKQETEAKLIARNASKEQMKTWSVEWDKQVINYAVSYSTDLLKDVTALNSESKLSKIALSVSQENFGNTIVKGIYDQLKNYPDERQKIKDDVRLWANNAIEVLEQKENISIDVQKSNFATLQSKYRRAIIQKNYNLAQGYIDMIVRGESATGEKLFNPALTDLQSDIDSIVSDFATKNKNEFFVDRDLQSQFNIKLVQNKLTIDMVENNKNKLGFQTSQALLEKIRSQNDSAFTKAVSVLKTNYNVSDFNIASNDGKTVFAVDYIDAYNQLMDYYLTLPQDAAPQDLINKAKELTQERVVEDVVSQGLDLLASDIEDKMSGNTRYFLLAQRVQDKYEDSYDKSLTFGQNIVKNSSMRGFFIQQLYTIQMRSSGGTVADEAPSNDLFTFMQTQFQDDLNLKNYRRN